MIHEETVELIAIPPIRQLPPCKIDHVLLPISPKTGSRSKIASEFTGYFA